MTPERKLAKEAGERTYLAANPCRAGHTTPRSTSSGACLECARLYFQKNQLANPEMYRARCRRYYAENVAQERARARVKYRANPEAHREAVKRWGKANPEYANAVMNASRHNGRARKLGVPGVLTPEDIIAVREASNGMCAVCSVTERLSIDHIEPLSMRGPNTRENLQILCDSCNSAKRDYSMDDFMARRAAA